MLLAIDSGNTNIVFAVFNAENKLCGEWRAASNVNRTSDEFSVWLQQLMKLDNITKDSIKNAIIGNVVPANLLSLQNLCRNYFGCEPLLIGDASINLGMELLVDNPNEVGADRICNAVSAFSTYGGPVTVIDFGTATSFDVVDIHGNYLGGVIAPGINLSLEALHMGAAQLPRVAVEVTKHIIGKNTVSAIQSGVFWGYVSMIEGLSARVKKEMGCDMPIVATGGLAAIFTKSTKSIDHWDKTLTLRGLLDIYSLNEK